MAENLKNISLKSPHGQFKKKVVSMWVENSDGWPGKTARGMVDNLQHQDFSQCITIIAIVLEKNPPSRQIILRASHRTPPADCEAFVCTPGQVGGFGIKKNPWLVIHLFDDVHECVQERQTRVFCPTNTTQKLFSSIFLHRFFRTEFFLRFTFSHWRFWKIKKICANKG